MDIEDNFERDKFDIIYMFNVFYAIKNKKDILERLSFVSKENAILAILAIFDYSMQNSNNKFVLNDLAGKPMYPIAINLIKDCLKDAGWDLLEVVDLCNKYEEWYETSINKLNLLKDDLLQEFTEESFFKVLETFSVILDSLKNNRIGGSAIYSKCNKSTFLSQNHGNAIDKNYLN